MLRNEDEDWLRIAYPRLTAQANSLAGVVEFRASYDSQSNRFLILEDSASDEIGGLALSGKFTIRIEERVSKGFSSLPAVFLDDVDVTESRHFGRDRSACLCSPFEEGEFLRPEFQFRNFFEQLVIPFLYGQVFYDMKGDWPWREYSHGATGIFEAYADIVGEATPRDCLRLLRQYELWKRIRDALLQKPYVKGHTPLLLSKNGSPSTMPSHSPEGREALTAGRSRPGDCDRIACALGWPPRIRGPRRAPSVSPHTVATTSPAIPVFSRESINPRETVLIASARSLPVLVGNL